MDARLVDGKLYSTAELALLLGIDPSSLRRWRTASPPCGPAFVRVSPRVVKYSAEDVETWLRDSRTDPRRLVA
ncbi:helix-turn-helix domain-containing protein [Nocardia puris]|uniref:helix-turn-helix transcriptional regulator n=1 Tax=Nocardia puris TaxID=208602 RepID=UPI001895CE4C|nr:helix-turn-helix domain-containing protein [Nocardia puris]MBF6215185.1 helix-turn-helix domain-containing protein [Nocardia puris]MBF6369765.1 helix-turn-helix domain-containing protein [Nocardia puris]MBF6463355.1 helix-turn-helix domain-containing protein [Nocardia puris]